MEITLNVAEYISIAIILITLIISFLHQEKKGLRLIQLYIFISLFVNVILKILDYSLEKASTRRLSNLFINIYSLLEISILFFFLRGIIKERRFRISMNIFFLLYILICAIVWTFLNGAIFKSIPALYGFENLFLTIWCFFFMYETMKSDLIINFKSDSNFIAICGILFYFSITTPFFFSIYTLNKIGLQNLFYFFNSISYTLLFIAFMKAYLCPIQELKNQYL